MNRLQFFKPSISWALAYKYLLAIENQYGNTSFLKKLRKTSADKGTPRSLREASAGFAWGTEQTPAAALPKSTRGSRGQRAGCKPAVCPRAGQGRPCPGLCELGQSQQLGEGHCCPLEVLGDTSVVTGRCSGLCGVRGVIPLGRFLRGSRWEAEHQACEERLEKLGLFRRWGD